MANPGIESKFVVKKAPINDYPRLVRSHSHPSKEWLALAKAPIPSEMLYERLAREAQSLPGDKRKAMGVFLELANTYGILDEKHGDSLQTWLEATARAWVLVEVYKFFQDTFEPHVAVSFHYDEATAALPSLLHGWVFAELSLVKAVTKRSQEASFKNDIAIWLLKVFQRSISTRVFFDVDSQRFVARVGALAWMNYELANLFQSGATMRCCGSCKRIIPAHLPRKRAYCNEACKQKAKRNRKENDD
jgi:hypothetical protein